MIRLEHGRKDNQSRAMVKGTTPLTIMHIVSSANFSSHIRHLIRYARQRHTTVAKARNDARAPHARLAWQWNEKEKQDSRKRKKLSRRNVDTINYATSIIIRVIL